MTVTNDQVALNQWIVCGWPDQVAVGESYRTGILGQEIEVVRRGTEEFDIFEYHEGEGRGRQLPVQLRYCCIFTTLGEPSLPLAEIEAFGESDRRIANCGSIGINTCVYRIVENFLDMAHFPFIHNGTLGAADHAEVFSYKTEHRKEDDEIWATDCKFFQPAASRGSTEGQMTHYTYRVMSPFSAMFYKTSFDEPDRDDALCLFVQPITETKCLAYMPMALVDPNSDMTSIIDFQQSIFLQDRIILENQRPALLPLAPLAELPTRADATSIAYRRWLKDKDIEFGIYEKQAA